VRSEINSFLISILMYGKQKCIQLKSLIGENVKNLMKTSEMEKYEIYKSTWFVYNVLISFLCIDMRYNVIYDCCKSYASLDIVIVIIINI
jgi:hypothetical protein